MSQDAAALLIAQEVLKQWKTSPCIPLITERSVQRKVNTVLTKYWKLKHHLRMTDLFQAELNTLLYISSKKLSALETQICPQYQDDYEFLVGQMHYPQTTRITATIDAADVALQERSQKRRDDREAYYEKQRMNTSLDTSLNSSTLDTSLQSLPSTPTPSKSPRVNHGIATSAIITTPRSRRSLKLSLPEVDCDTHDDDNMILSDPRDSVENIALKKAADPLYIPPVRYEKEQTKRPEFVTLNLPTRAIPEVLAKTNTATQTSPRVELKQTATLLQAGGASINDVTLSTSTIRRKRKRTVSGKAKNIKDDFEKPDYGVAHFDGKIVQYANGKTEDRLAVVMSAPTKFDRQFLGSPVIPNGTGTAQAAAIRAVLTLWGLLACVVAMVFDTTASNTGWIRGAATILEQILRRPVIWIGCRHHTGELHIKHAYLACRGDQYTKGNHNQLYKRLRSDWERLHQWIVNHPDQYSRWEWPADPNDWKHKRGESVSTVNLSSNYSNLLDIQLKSITN